MIILTGGTKEQQAAMRKEALESGEPKCAMCGFTERQHPNPWHTQFQAEDQLEANHE